MALSEEVKLKWYEALFEEDCITVMELLDAHPKLLKVGWKSEPSREVEGRRRREGTGRTRSTWMGRTALHVGASRGCVKLIMQLLRLRKFDAFDEVDQVYQRSLRLLEDFSFSNFESNSGFVCDECNEKLDKKNRWRLTGEGDYDLCPDCFAKQGNQEVFTKIEHHWRKPPVMGTIWRTNSEASSSLGESTEVTLGQSPDASPAPSTAQGDRQTGREHAQLEKTDPVSLNPAARRFQNVVSTVINVRKIHQGKSEEQASGVILSSKDLRYLLTAKDEKCGLDVVSIAALHGNQEIGFLLEYAQRKNDGYSPDYAKAQVLANFQGSASTWERRKLLRQTIVEEIEFFRVLKESYNDHRDFNFLPPEEYLFHFIFADGSKGWAMPALLTAVRSREGQLWRFLLELKDGQGRPPFHVAMAEGTHEDFVEAITGEKADEKDASGEKAGEREFVVCALTASDAVGRTPIHRAAATGLHETVKILLEYASRYEEVAATCNAPWRFNKPEGIPEDMGSVYFGSYLCDVGSLHFQLPQTPLHAAIVYGNFTCAKLLIEKREFKWGDVTYRSIDEHFIDTVFGKDSIKVKTQKTDWGQDYRAWIEWDIVELACLAGAPSHFVRFVIDHFKVNLNEQLLPDIDGLQDEKRTEPVILKHLWHPILLVASSGRYDTLRYFKDDLQCNPYLEDYHGNSTLHHAMKVTEFKLRTHLLDYFSAEHVSLANTYSSRMGATDDLAEKNIAERQGCINELLQAGCYVFKANNQNQVPYPRGSVKDAKFLSWWYNKQENEFKTSQNNLNFATNAIAVTATLVATASYVGPLQPPMGYDANQIQYENPWVSIFIVCDTLSFYLAIVAIILSLIIALPVPQQPMMDELQRTRGMVILAVGILIPSIFFVFVAFASSSISVMSANITSQVGGILTIVSTLIGIILCSLAFALFIVKLLAFHHPRRETVRNVYELSNYITKFSE